MRHIKEYILEFRADRSKHGGGIIEILPNPDIPRQYDNLVHDLSKVSAVRFLKERTSCRPWDSKYVLNDIEEQLKGNQRIGYAELSYGKSGGSDNKNVLVVGNIDTKKFGLVVGFRKSDGSIYKCEVYRYEGSGFKVDQDYNTGPFYVDTIENVKLLNSILNQ